MDSTSTLAAARTDVFGKDPVLGTDGLPLERGVGSHWQRAEHIVKARFHAATAWDAAGELVGQAKAILAVAERVAAASKASVEAAALAKTDVPIVADPKLDKAYLDLKAQYDQAVAERDVLKNLPAATAHNVARNGEEQRLLDDYRAEQERAAKQKIEDARLKKVADDKAKADALLTVKPDGQNQKPVVPAAVPVPTPAPVFTVPVNPVPPAPIVPTENSNLSFAATPGV